jgi:hypothetical protein
MQRIALAMLTLCLGCGVAPQPESARTVAAFEVPLPTPQDRAEFLSLLSSAAEPEGLHVDASSEEELERLSEVSPITIRAAVWRGVDDDEPLASVMDLPDNLGRAWLFFSRGEDTALATRFRQRAMRQILARWPRTQSLPIMPDGSIPLPRDLRPTPHGYRVEPEAASRNGLLSTSPLVAPN